MQCESMKAGRRFRFGIESGKPSLLAYVVPLPFVQDAYERGSVQLVRPGRSRAWATRQS